MTYQPLPSQRLAAFAPYQDKTFTMVRCLSEGGVAIIFLDRPQALNALSELLMDEIGAALDLIEADDAIGAIVLAGSREVFAAGADIKEMLDKTFVGSLREDLIARNWDRVPACRKPIIAAVAGIAAGGGCELAMMCDIVLAAENVRFSLAEILVGTIGGTQRLTRAIGKAKAMEMVLTGRIMAAAEAERSGAVSRILPVEDLLDDAIATAGRIAALSQPVVMMGKECVNRCYETSLSEGMLFERRLFHATFALQDRREGMLAFLEKRSPNFAHR